MREHRGSSVRRLVNDDVLEFFDATRLDVVDKLPVEDGRFSIAIVIAGECAIEGDFGSEPIRTGETLACPASLSHRFRAGRSPLQVIRCVGPALPSA